MLPRYDALILGLGGVIFNWTPSDTSSISPRTFRSMLSSNTWQDYERGKISEVTCFHELSGKFKVTEEDVANAFSETKKSVKVNDEIVAVLKELKNTSGKKPKIYAMSNMPSDIFEFVRTMDLDRTLIDATFISGTIGMRKPDIRFFHHVLKRIDSDPRKIVFLDRRLDNVLAATSLGMHGVMYDGVEKVTRSLRNLFGDPVQKGRDWLQANMNRMETVTMKGQVVPEWFSAFFILESTGDQYAVPSRRCNFFNDAKVAAAYGIPDDIDTTAVAFTVFKDLDQNLTHSILDDILEFRNEDGIVQSYFDRTRPRTDPVQAVNVLTLFHQHGRGHEPRLSPTLKWVHGVLLSRAYLGGSRYYTTAEWFFFALGRLIRISDDTRVQNILKPLLRQRVQERVGGGGDALTLAMRIIACGVVGVKNMVDLRVLLPLQCEDGGFDVCWLYRMGKTGMRMGNRGVPTALAVEAINVFANSEEVVIPETRDEVTMQEELQMNGAVDEK